MSLKDKIATICKEMYGADGVDYSELAEQRLAVRNLLSVLTWFKNTSLRVNFTFFFKTPNPDLHRFWLRQSANLHGKNAVLTQYRCGREGIWFISNARRMTAILKLSLKLSVPKHFNREYPLVSEYSWETSVLPSEQVTSILFAVISWQYPAFQPDQASMTSTWILKPAASLDSSRNSASYVGKNWI